MRVRARDMDKARARVKDDGLVGSGMMDEVMGLGLVEKWLGCGTCWG